MKKYTIGIISMLLLLSSSLFATEKTDISIFGHVIDSVTREHIPYATIIIKGTPLGLVTDASGHYMLNNIAEGVQIVSVTCVGYHSKDIQIVANSNSNQTVNFELKAKSTFINEIVVTGNRYATRKRETSTLVGVISPLLFEKTSAVTPAGVLNFQPGSRVEYNCGNCGNPQLRINGLSGQYSQILLDSKPMFSSLGMVYGIEQLPSSMIERIEVIRGGGSALYGANAIAGTVNIITKEPIRNLLQISNQTGVIGGNAMDVNTSINGSVISSDRRTGAYIFSMVRNRDEYDHNGDDLSEIPALKGQTLGFRAFQKVGMNSKLTGEYHYIHEYRRGGDSLGLTPHRSNIAEELDHNINGGSLGFDYNSPNTKHSLNSYVGLQHIDRKSYFGVDQNLNAYGTSNDFAVNAGAQWIHKIKKAIFMPSTLTAGVDYSHSELQDRMLGYNREIDQTTDLIGVYAQNEWKVEKFSFLIGARLDKHNLLDNPIASPRVNFRYAPNENLTFRTSYARGYRAPQVYDEDLHVGAVGGEITLIELDPNLKAEYSNSVNLSVDYWRTFGSWQVNILAEGFYTKLKDVFGLIQTGTREEGDVTIIEQLRVNESGAYVAGVNAELRAAYLTKLDIQAGFTTQKSRYDDPFTWNDNVAAKKRMFRAPDNYGYVNVNYNLNPITISANGTYTGNMLLQHNATMSNNNIDQNVISPTFFELDLRVAYDFNITKDAKMQLSVAVKNLLDEFQDDLDYGITKDSKYFYGPALPRSFFMGVKLSF